MSQRNNSIQTSPQQIRQHIRQCRQQLSAMEQQQAPLQVIQHLREIERVRQAQHIALFLSFDGELNTQPLIDYFWQQGQQIYLPVLHPFSKGHLLFLHYDAQTPLETHQFGMAQPALNVNNVIPVAELDIIFTPLVAFDEQGNRVGMGKGYYDRTLANWQQKDIYPIGLAHDCQLVEQIETNHWDVPLPEIITPSTHWIFDSVL